MRAANEAYEGRSTCGRAVARVPAGARAIARASACRQPRSQSATRALVAGVPVRAERTKPRSTLYLIWVMPAERAMFLGCQFSLYPMTNGFVGVILDAIKPLDDYR